MNLIKKINWENTHLYFFYLFLFSIPFQTRKVFLTEYSFYSGDFTEYATLFIYASDVLLILTLFFWFVFNKKLHKYFNVSLRRSLSAEDWDEQAQDSLESSVERLQRGGKSLKNSCKLPLAWLLLLIFIIWLIINIVINNTYTEISVFYILKFVELFLLVIYIYFNLKNKKRLTVALFVISFAGFFQGLVAIYQFIYQCPLFKSPLLHRITGESTVYPQAIGIAKIVVDNEKIVRAYGTFPHPNLLGGFLIVSILISIYLLLKHKNYILSIFSSDNLFYNTNNIKSQARTTTSSSLGSLFWILFIFTQITALLFTFSRSAWAGFLISLFLVIIFYFYNSKIVSRETILDELNITDFSKKENAYYRLFYRFKELIVVFLLTIILIITYFPYISSRINKDVLVNNHLSSHYLPSNHTFDDRTFYNNVSRETISENFILGSGVGTSIFQIDSYLIKNNIYQKLEPWQYQPAHNIYLLIISEIGIVGFIIFALFIAKFVIVSLSKYDKFSVLPILQQAQDDNLKFFNNKLKNKPASKIVSRETIRRIYFAFIKTIKKILLIETFWIPASAGMTKKVEMTMNKKILNKLGFPRFRHTGVSLRRTSANLALARPSPLRRDCDGAENELNNNKIVSRETITDELSKKTDKDLNYYLIAVFVSFLFIGLFDHYFWTLQQGRLIFWLVLGLIFVNNCDIKRSST